MKKFLSIVAILSLIFSPSTPVFATSAVWDGEAGVAWDTNANWVGDPAEVPISGQTATFSGPGGGNVIIDLGGGATITSLVFDTAAAAGYTIGTGLLQSLVLDPAGSIIMNAAVANTQTIASQVFFNGTASFTNNATDNTKLLSFSGPVTGVAAAGQLLTIGGTNTGNNEIGGIISNGLGGGAVAITKTGAGKWVLSGVNTYTGGTGIDAGVLNIQDGSALGGVGNGTTVAAGATLELEGGISVGAEALALSGTLSNVSGANSWAGAISLGGDAAITNEDADILDVFDLTTVALGTYTLTVSGAGETIANAAISGTGDLVKEGAGILSLNSEAEYTGATTVTEGTLRLSVVDAIATSSDVTVDDTLDIYARNQTVASLAGAATGLVTSSLAGAVTLTTGGNDSDTTFAGVIEDGAGTLSLAKEGIGTFTVSGVNTYTGTMTITGGTLSVADADGLGDTSGNTTVGEFGTLDINNVAIAVGEDVTVNGGTITGTGAGASLAGTVTLGADSTVGGAGTLTLSGAIGESVASGIEKTGAGTVNLNAANTYTGLTTVSAGILSVGDPAGLGDVSGNTTVGASGTLDINNVTIAADESITLNGGTITGTGVGAAIAGTITLGASSTLGGTGTLALNGVIDGAFDIEKTGAGTVELMANNTYVGTTTVSDGTLNVQHSNALGGDGTAVANGATLAMETAIAVAEALELAGQGDGDAGALRSLSDGTNWQGAINVAADARINSDAGTFTVSGGVSGDGSRELTVGGAGNTTVSGVIDDGTGTVSLVKDGVGTLILSNVNTYTGDTTVSTGTLSLSNANSNNISTSAMIDVQTGTFLDVTGLSGSELVLASGQTLMGNGTVTGALTVDSGSTVAPGASVGTLISVGDVTYAGGGTYTWEITDATGGAGTGWDLHDITGNLLITATDVDQFTITFDCVAVANFDKWTGYDWTIAQVGVDPDAITWDLNADDFVLDTDAFTSHNGIGNGSFSISLDATTKLLQINYTAATPELVNPSYWSGDTATGLWNTINAGPDTNWEDSVGGDPGLYPDATCGVVFRNVVGEATTLGENFEIISLTMLDGSGDVSIEGANILTLNASENGFGIVIDDNGGSLEIKSDVSVVLDNAQTWANNDVTNGSVLTVAGAVDNNGFHLTVGGAGDTTISGVLSGTEGLTKTGDGTLTLSNDNTYAGETNINGGKVSIDGDLSLGAAPVGVTAGHLTLNGGTLEASDDVLLNSNRGIALGAGGGTFDVDDTKTLTYGGIIAGTGSLTKTDTGTLVLDGANTFTGDTTISAGVLEVGNADALSTSSSVTVNTDNGLQFSAGINDVTLQNLGGTGDLVLEDGAAAAVALTADNAADTELSGDISGAGSLTKDGVGELILSGANTYTGDTTISGGTLQIGKDGDAGSLAGNVVFDGDNTLALEEGSLGGNITTTDGNGTLRFNAGGNSDITGTVGTDANRLKAIAIDVAVAQAATFDDDTFTDSLAIGGAGTADFNAQAAVTNNVVFTDDGVADFGGQTAVGGTVTTGTDGEGEMIFRANNSTVTGQVGTDTNRLREIEIAIAVADEEATFEAAVYADLITVSSAGKAVFNGNVIAPIDFTADGVVDLAANRTITGNVTSTGGTHGTLNFLGTSATGGTIGTGANPLDAIIIQAGTLSLDHNIAATTTSVNNAGTLALTGDRTITGDLTLNNTGTLNVGANTLNLTGDYAQNAGTTLQLSINSATVFGSILAAGDASVAAASVVEVTVMNTYIASGTTFTVIDGAGGGGVLVPTITATGGRITFTGAVVAGDLILTANVASTFATIPGASGNAQAVGAVLDQLWEEGPTGDMLDVLTTLNGLSDEQVDNAMESMHPDVSSGTMAGSRALTNQFLGSVSNRLGYFRSGLAQQGIATGDTYQGGGFWMQGLGNHAKQGERDGIEGYQVNAFATSIGVDTLVDNHTRLGLSAGYGLADVNSKTAGRPGTNIDSWQGTIYGSYDSLDLCKKPTRGPKGGIRNPGQNSWYVDGMLGFTQNNYDSTREIYLGTDTRVAKADHHGQQYSTKVEGGYTFVFQQTKDLEVTPFASLGYNYLYMNQYKENGADALNLNVQGDGFHALEQALGTKFAYPVVTKDGTFIPSFKAAWLIDYIGDRYETTASFAGGGSSFQTYGADPAKNGFLLGTELGYLNKKNMTLTANWDWEMKEEYQSFTYYVTARFDF